MMTVVRGGVATMSAARPRSGHSRDALPSHPVIALLNRSWGSSRPLVKSKRESPRMGWYVPGRSSSVSERAGAFGRKRKGRPIPVASRTVQRTRQIHCREMDAGCSRSARARGSGPRARSRRRKSDWRMAPAVCCRTRRGPAPAAARGPSSGSAAARRSFQRGRSCLARRRCRGGSSCVRARSRG